MGWELCKQFRDKKFSIQNLFISIWFHEINFRSQLIAQTLSIVVLLSLLTCLLSLRFLSSLIQHLNVVWWWLLLSLSRLYEDLTRSHPFATEVIVNDHSLPRFAIIGWRSFVLSVSEEKRDKVSVIRIVARAVAGLCRYGLCNEGFVLSRLS